MNYIKFFNDITIHDIASVGGKNASLGEMIRNLTPRGINIPQGFALTAQAYWQVIDENNLREPVANLLSKIRPGDLHSLEIHAAQIRNLIGKAILPDDVGNALHDAYAMLSNMCASKSIDVAVRSSATAEDLPTASFAGQQETYLNIRGTLALEQAVKQCMASLFTNRAITYRREHGFDDFAIAISIGVQQMVRSDLGCAGVMFTLDTESGFKDAMVITGSYGLGENIVKGIVNPDEFVVYKPLIQQNFVPVIKKELGTKTQRLIYSDKGATTKNVPVSLKEQQQFCLSDQEILELAHQGIIIEEYYSSINHHWTPMDIEWAVDDKRTLYIVQARPETVHAQQKPTSVIQYHLKDNQAALKPLIVGQSIGKKIVSGIARCIPSIDAVSTFNEGDIMVTRMTDPDWVPLMKKSGGIITDLGGRTCHAAIVARELGIPAIIGTNNATSFIRDGMEITLDCSQGSQGFVYQGIIPFEETKLDIEKLPCAPVDILVNLADPQRAFDISFLPTSGVGLARLEFIISTMIKVHPMAIAKPDAITDKHVREAIEQLARPYPSLKDFYVDSLAQAIGMIAAAFYPRPVIVRLTDFKSNEYRDLLGGTYFEPQEENPMLGFRGAVRYCSEQYAPAFALECAALKKAREHMGFSNIKIMIPFVRTVAEAHATVDALRSHGLERGKHNLELLMMVEIPSNVLLIQEFAQFFDGFSIGSNDLTQLTLGVDRDSGLLTPLFDERDPAVKQMLRMAIEGAHAAKKYIGICGQAPSDYPEIAQFLIEHKIDSLSLNPDSVIPFLLHQPKT